MPAGGRVLTGLGEDLNAHYTPKRRVIEVSESRVLKCESRECIEQLMLHELGHACQHFRQGTGGMFLLSKLCVASGGSTDDLDGTVGLETRQCIQNAIEKESAAAKSKNQPVCASQWSKEAFADVIFSAWWKKPAHWAWDCDAREDAAHASTRSYMHCIFDRAEPRRTVCDGT